MKHHCPKCQRVLYNRRLKSCGFCGTPIPEEFRFTLEETAALERKAADLELARKQRQLAQEAQSVVDPPVIIPIIIP